jgi:hypothetical protein
MRHFPAAIIALLLAAQHPAAAADRLEFTRLIAHWDSYADPAYLDFVRDAQPEIAQLGFYGAHFYSLAHTDAGRGYPAHFPLVGLAENADWLATRNAEVHKLGVKVVGHFNVEFLVGDPATADKPPTGFFKFYRDLWDEKQLGPRPAIDPLNLLEKNADGTPISQKGYGIGGMREHWACLRNPAWRAVLKAWVRRAIEHGRVDGLIANYFYRHNCLCEHCQTSFRAYLKARFTPAELLANFDIKDVDRHAFTDLPYWHDPKSSTPLRLESLRWSQVSNKDAFDEIFVTFGRSLKPDLIVAQWNHLGDFNQVSGDERCLLPADLWGKGEDYLWYSTGDAANASDVKAGFLGDATLQARYVRGAFDDKPFTLGKYENTRIRTAIAELAANGGAPMGFYTRFTDPAARAEIVRYYQFLKRHDDLFRASRPHAEAVLLYPRAAVHAGDVAPVAKFKETGKALLDAHVLFDVLPDDLATPPRLAPYRLVLKSEDPALTEAQRAVLSTCQAPPTVRVSASRPAAGHDLVLHFVNYERDEPPKGKDGKPSPGRGIVDEKPIPARGVTADVLLPPGAKLKAVEAMTPEHPDPVTLDAKSDGLRVHFTVPDFLVYAVVRLHLE